MGDSAAAETPGANRQDNAPKQGHVCTKSASERLPPWGSRTFRVGSPPHVHLHRSSWKVQEVSRGHALWPPARLSQGSTCVQLTFTDSAGNGSPEVTAGQVSRSGRSCQGLGTRGAGTLCSPTRDIFRTPTDFQGDRVR